MLKLKTPILWPPDVKNWLIGKDPHAGKDWRWEKGTTEDEMVGWHHRLYGHKFEQALGTSDRQGRQACCSPWGHKELDMTERLDWTELHVWVSNETAEQGKYQKQIDIEIGVEFSVFHPQISKVQFHFCIRSVFQLSHHYTTNIQSKLKDTNLLKTFRNFPGSPAVKSLPAEAGHWVWNLVWECSTR